MKPILLPMLVLLALASLPGLLPAQKLDLKLISTAGGSAQANAGTLDWSLGELCITAQTNAYHYWGQGFQQAWIQASLTTDVTDAFDANQQATISLLVYPNPAADFITIEADDKIAVQLYDLLGRPLNSRTLVNTPTQFDLRHLPAGLYVLHVFDKNGRMSATVKIQHLD